MRPKFRLIGSLLLLGASACISYCVAAFYVTGVVYRPPILENYRQTWLANNYPPEGEYRQVFEKWNSRAQAFALSERYSVWRTISGPKRENLVGISSREIIALSKSEMTKRANALFCTHGVDKEVASKIIDLVENTLKTHPIEYIIHDFRADNGTGLREIPERYNNGIKETAVKVPIIETIINQAISENPDKDVRSIASISLALLNIDKFSYVDPFRPYYVSDYMAHKDGSSVNRPYASRIDLLINPRQEYRIIKFYLDGERKIAVNVALGNENHQTYANSGGGEIFRYPSGIKAQTGRCEVIQ